MSENNSAQNGVIAQDLAEIEIIKNELITDGVNPEKAEVIVQRIVRRSVIVRSSPLPTVEEFKGYDDICPGAARDILNMSKDALAHRIKIETDTLSGDILIHSRNIFAAMLIIGGVLCAVVYLAMNGHDWVAAILASGTGIAAIVAAFFRSKMKKEN